MKPFVRYGPRRARPRRRDLCLADVLEGRTITGASWLQLKSAKGNKTDQAAAVGKELARRAKDAGIESVVFDRGGYLYHGRVKALADAAREGGLKF